MIEGLSSNQAKEKLSTYGFNEMPTMKAKNIGHIAYEVVKEPMFILLISSGILYIILGDLMEGVILLATILIIVFITFYQYQKTEKALYALKQLAAPRALVIRDNIEIRIPGREVVPGDIIILSEGDRISADAKLIESSNLLVDESILTGESFPVVKDIIDVPGQHKTIVFSGTNVVQGRCIAEVLNTGINTEFGKIGTSIQNISQDKTRLQIEMKVLVRNLFAIGFILSIAVILTFYFTRGNLLQSILNGLAAAMAILPEEFPVVLTLFLVLGAWRLSKINVLTRNPSAIETLGSTTVLCSDKTGTITQNKMELELLYDGTNVYFKKDFLNNKIELTNIINIANHASQKKAIDPMEKAIVNVYNEFQLPTINHTLIKEYPLTKEFLAITRVLENDEKNIPFICTKGAPETIFKLCKLNQEETLKHKQMVDQCAAQGFRMIGVAQGTFITFPLPKNQQDFNFNFIGLIGFEDPIRPEVPQAIKECVDAGIKVIMITGDYMATAKNIAQQIGLASNDTCTGDELLKMNEKVLPERIKNTTIFARVAPQQKLTIVQALKSNHEVVAMTGDGVNDAPALKAAHIGIAMGNKGTDVAREASSLVLLDDHFASIVAGMRSGRRIFDNLQKAMSYIIAIHIPIIGLTLLPSAFSSLPLILMPLHIVFMELIIDPVCSIAFEYEQEEKGIMQRPPRNYNEKFFGGKKMAWSVLKGFLLLFMVLVIYFNSINEGHSEGEVRAITFCALIIGNMLLILTELSKTRSFLAVFSEKNYAVIIILVTAMLMLILIISIPYLQHLFSFEFPGYYHFIPSIIGSACILLVLEAVKYFMYSKNAKADIINQD